MTKQTTDPQEDLEVSAEELDQLDAKLAQIDTLYRSRCITPRTGNNVTVREIEKSDK